MSKDKITVADFFADIGGIWVGFERAGAESVWANDNDRFCAETYMENFEGDEVSKSFGFKKGNLSKAGVEALEIWIKKQKRKRGEFEKMTVRLRSGITHSRVLKRLQGFGVYR